MTNFDIESQINKEFHDFKDGIYKGTPKVPENIIDLFKKGIMCLSPQSHQINFSKIKQIVEKKSNELTIGDLNEVVKIVVNTPLSALFGNDLKAAIDSQIKLEKFIISYNSTVSSFQETLKMKTASLKSLARGVQGNGMKVITA